MNLGHIDHPIRQTRCLGGDVHVGVDMAGHDSLFRHVENRRCMPRIELWRYRLDASVDDPDSVALIAGIGRIEHAAAA